jgi:hypothetical protein
MGLLRWAVIIGTGGLAPIRGASPRERTAKATERAARSQRSSVNPRTPPIAVSNATIARVRAERQEKGARAVASELQHLGELHKQGVLTDKEFRSAKARILDL